MTKKKTRSSLCNPVMFSIVMKDEELFRELLSRILPDRKIRSLRLHDGDEDPVTDSLQTLLQTEQSIMINPYAKAVRFDVLFEDDDTWFDVEMQTTDTKSLPQRSRYYHAAAAVDSLKKGQEYHTLKPGYVIFICLFDLFGKDEPVYSFEMYDAKNLLQLRDGQLTIFLNTACRKKYVPERLKNLFLYLEEGAVAESDPWIARLQNTVKQMEQEKEVRSKMTLYDEWVRTACTMERLKEGLEAAQNELKTTESELKSKAQQLDTAQCELKSKAQQLDAAQCELKSKAQQLDTAQCELKSKAQQLDAAHAKIKALEANADQQRFESLLKCLLDQGRIEDMQKALNDTGCRDLLYEELGL